MRRLRVIVGVMCIAVAVTWAGVLMWFSWASHNIATHMQVPVFEAEDRPAANFAFQTLDGKTVHLADYKGKVVLLDLWGTWCVQCVAEMPTVQKLYQNFDTDPKVQFLIVSRMDSVERVRHFAEKDHYTLPFFVMRDEDIPNDMRMNQFPSTFLYNQEGRLVAQHVGAADWSAPSVIQAIRKLE